MSLFKTMTCDDYTLGLEILEVPQCITKVTLPWQKRRQIRILKHLSNTKSRDGCPKCGYSADLDLGSFGSLHALLDIWNFFISLLLNYYAKPDLVFHKIPFLYWHRESSWTHISCTNKWLGHVKTLSESLRAKWTFECLDNLEWKCGKWPSLYM